MVTVIGECEHEVNRQPGAIVSDRDGKVVHALALDGAIDGVMAIRLEDARITGLNDVRNPVKLSRVEPETPLTRR